MGARVGHEHAEAVAEEQICVTSHAEAIVAHAVEKDYDIAGTTLRPEIPGSQNGAVSRSDRDVVERTIDIVRLLFFPAYLIWRNATPIGTQRALCQKCPGDERKREVMSGARLQSALPLSA